MQLGFAASATTALYGAGALTAVRALLRLTPWPHAGYITAGSAVIIAAVLVITYRGRSAPGWIAHRYHSTRRTPRLVQIISHDGTAICWDHTRNHASIIIGITRKPFTINICDQDNIWSAPAIDLDPIRAALRQFDIRLHDITLVSAGYTHARQNAIARIAFATTGPINALTYGRTYLRVTIDTAACADSVEAREIDKFDDPRHVLASGLARTIQIAAARVHRAITLQGLVAEKLSRQQAMDLHLQLAELLTPAVNSEGFRHAGAGPHLVAFTPTKDCPRTHSDWLHATTEPCAAITRLTPHGDTDRLEQLYVNRVDRLDSVRLAEANHLRREHGQHAAIAATALPLAVPPPVTAIPARRLNTDTAAGSHYMPGGVGIFLGHTARGLERVWLDITVPSPEPLWLIGPPDIVHLFLIRAAALGLRIDARAPELQPAVQALRHCGVGAHQHPDLVISAVGQENTPQAPVRVIWSPTPIAQHPQHHLTATQPGTLHVHTQGMDVQVRWELHHAEAALLPEMAAVLS